MWKWGKRLGKKTEHQKRQEEFYLLNQDTYDFRSLPDMAMSGRCHFLFQHRIGEGYPEFSSLCLEIADELLRNLQVAAHVCRYHPISEDERKLRKKKKLPTYEYFPACYYSQLVAQGEENRAFLSGEMDLILLSQGVDQPLFRAMVTETEVHHSINRFVTWTGVAAEIIDCGLTFYGYQKFPFVPDTCEHIMSALGQDTCDIFIEYHYHPESLEILVREDMFGREAVLNLVRAICTRNQKILSVEESI